MDKICKPNKNVESNIMKDTQMKYLVVNVEWDKLVVFITENVENFSNNWKVSTLGAYSWVTVGPMDDEECDDLIDSIQQSDIVGYNIVTDEPVQGTVYTLR